MNNENWKTFAKVHNILISVISLTNETFLIKSLWRTQIKKLGKAFINYEVIKQKKKGTVDDFLLSQC